jgi:hypothetical protein
VLADPHTLGRHAPFLTFPHHRGLGRRQVHQRADGVAGAVHAARFQVLREAEEKHHGRAFQPVADRDGADDGNRHQHVHVEGAQTQSAPRAADRGHAAKGDGQQRRQLRGRRPPRGVGGQAQGQRRAAGSQHPSTSIGPPGAASLFVLEPCAHARVGDRADNGAGGQTGGVVLHAQPARNHIRAERLEASQMLESTLDECHFLVAVQALDLENRLGVDLADGADRGRTAHGSALPARAGLAHVVEALRQQPHDVVVVEAVMDHTPVTPRANQAKGAKKAELMGGR